MVKHLTIFQFLVLASGLGLAIAITILWWAARAGNWFLYTSWNTYHDAYVEGVILHSIIVATLVAMILQVKKERMPQ